MNDTPLEKDRSSETEKERLKREADEELDSELMDTFPASDAPTITRASRSQHRRVPENRKI